MFDSAEGAAGSHPATLTCGANSQQVTIPEGGITVAQMLDRYADIMNLPSQNDGRQVLLNGSAASVEDLVGPNDQVEVIRQAGEKG